MSSKKNYTPILLMVVFALTIVMVERSMAASLKEIEIVPSSSPKVWGAYKNKRFGFEAYYPSDWFKPGAFPVEKSGLTFTSEDGQATIAAYGMLDPRWYGAELFDEKRIVAEGRAYEPLARYLYPQKLKNSGNAYASLIEKKVSGSSIILKGRRGTKIFHEKFIFYCKDKVIGVLSYHYEETAAAKYHPLVKKLFRRFYGGSGSDLPPCL